MINPRELLEGVTFNSSFDHDRLDFDEELGFIDVPSATLAGSGMRRVLGFAVPITSEGVFDDSDVVTPLTEYADLARSRQTIDLQGKGVGPRLFNTIEALAGMPEYPDTVGVYVVDIDTNRLLDGRAAQGNKAVRIFRHAGRIARAKLRGVEAEVDAIHASYGDVDAVALELPPHGLLRQYESGIQNPVTPEFIVIRNPHTLMHRVGQVAVEWVE